MANRLQLKRGSGAPGNIFYAGEPMYDESGKILYVGDTGGTGTGAGSSIASNLAYETVLQMLGRADATAAGVVKFYEDADNGTNLVTLSGPANVDVDYTITLPSSGPAAADQILSTDASGNLSFVNFLSIAADTGTTDPIIPADTITFAGTANEIETAVTDGQIQIGLPDNVIVGGALTVTTTTNLNGNVTIGDGVNTDDTLIINAGIGNTVLPSADNLYDLGSPTYQFKTVYANNISVADLTANRADTISVGSTDLNASHYLTFVAANSSPGTYQTSWTDGQLSYNPSTDLLTVSNITVSGTTTLNGNVDLGDAAEDLISITGSVDTNIIPTGTVNLGATGSRWDNLWANAVTIDNVQIGVSAVNEIDTDSGNLILDSAGGTVTIDDDATVTGSLTVNGDLRVVGTAVTFETETVRVEDRLIELGLVTGAEPTTTTTWDSGVAFNYFQTSAKKSGVVWLNNQFIAMLSELTDGGGTDNDSPQITVGAYAPVAAGSLYIGGIGAGNEVINSTQEAVNLIFDGGSY